jgi:hypothetical protein
MVKPHAVSNLVVALQPTPPSIPAIEKEWVVGLHNSMILLRG